jgi:hypothetical protein
LEHRTRTEENNVPILLLAAALAQEGESSFEVDATSTVTWEGDTTMELGEFFGDLVTDPTGVYAATSEPVPVLDPVTHKFAWIYLNDVADMAFTCDCPIGGCGGYACTMELKQHQTPSGDHIGYEVVCGGNCPYTGPEPSVVEDDPQTTINEAQESLNAYNNYVENAMICAMMQCQSRAAIIPR